MIWSESMLYIWQLQSVMRNTSQKWEGVGVPFILIKFLVYVNKQRENEKKNVHTEVSVWKFN